MAQITITGKVTDYKGKPLANITVKTDVITYTNQGYYVANYVKTDANGMYKIEAKQWDTIHFDNMGCYIVFKDTPHQVYKYSVMEKQELFEQYGYLSQYGLVAYTKDYYNQHKKNKSKKK